MAAPYIIVQVASSTGLPTSRGKARSQVHLTVALCLFLFVVLDFAWLSAFVARTAILQQLGRVAAFEGKAPATVVACSSPS